MNNQKKKSWFSYLFPYIILISIIVVIVLIVNGGNGSTIKYSEGEIIAPVTEKVEGKTDIQLKAEGSVLWNEDIREISITYYDGFIDISGKVVDIIGKNTREGLYTFESRITETETNKEVLTYILQNREYEVKNSSGVVTDTVVYYGDYAKFTIVNPYASNFWTDYFPIIFMSLIGIGLVFFIITRMGASISKSNSQSMEFNRSRAKREDNSEVRFDDVAGCDEEKQELMELVDYLKNPLKYASFGAKLPKGVLLVGSPGTGKTLMAKAVAGEAHVPFYSISGSDFVEMFVGVGAGRVRDMFKKAKQTAPCLIFIDEIDAVGRQRGAGLGGGNDEREQTLNQLLVEMDGFSDNQGIIVMAATNRSDILDPALMRAGRFDRQITVSLPDKVGREQILKVHARNKKIDSSVVWSNVAKRTVGFSGADLANIVNEAAILAVRNRKKAISIKEVDEAIDRRIAGPAKKSKHLNENERKTVAYHEAGHAIIGLTLPASDKVQKVTIVPRGMAGGYVLSTPEDDRFLLTKEELVAQIIGLLAGRSSEEVFFDDVSTGASNDIERATRIARAMVVEYGMSTLGPIQYETNGGSVFLGRDYTSNQKNFSSAVANEIDKEIRKIIDEAHQKAIDIIKERKDDVILIAETLLEVETLNSEEIEYLLKNRKMPEEKPQEVKKPLVEEKVETPVEESVKPLEETLTVKENETKE